jgi:hypothetical protein
MQSSHLFSRTSFHSSRKTNLAHDQTQIETDPSINLLPLHLVSPTRRNRYSLPFKSSTQLSPPNRTQSRTCSHTSRKAAVEKLSITIELLLYEFPMQYALPLPSNIPPNHLFLSIYTPLLIPTTPLQKRHNSAHNTQHPNPNLHTPRRTLPRHRRSTRTAHTRATRRRAPRSRRAPTCSLRSTRTRTRLHSRTSRQYRRSRNRGCSGGSGCG